MEAERSENSGCLLAILSVFGGKGAGKGASNDPLPYRLRDDFLSPAEASFLRVLHLVVKDQATIFAKVRLGDIFSAAAGRQYTSHMNRINSKHVDFLLCDPKSMKPLAGLELDDSSHARRQRQQRDAFVGRVFDAAGLPLLHVQCQRDYSVEALAAQVLPILTGQSAAPAAAPAPAASTPPATATLRPSAPLCPKCGVAMVPRMAKVGANAGNTFYGCPNYPRCRAVLND